MAATLLLIVELLTFSMPFWFVSAPPSRVLAFALNSQASIVTLPPLLKTAPPVNEALPFVTFRPLRLTTLPLLTTKTLKSGVPIVVLRCTVNWFAPGPVMVRFG